MVSVVQSSECPIHTGQRIARLHKAVACVVVHGALPMLLTTLLQSSPLYNHVNALCQRIAISDIVCSYLCLDAMTGEVWTRVDGDYATDPIVVL
jgi:hypothetical protein